MKKQVRNLTDVDALVTKSWTYVYPRLKYFIEIAAIT